ncbi:MAG TPA: SDR family NAD(P)-dependent oxidoreductase, partial [Woeseiaceae bacterium]|nr:SDR family NAD(P)-dependent oxidoreductase [Woeseiaceae bacterium]
MSPVLVTGGAGFIGSNLAARLLNDGEDVVVFDDLSRPGVEDNLRWLTGRFGDRVRHLDADIRDAAAVEAAVEGCSFVFHFAAQVAVTTSLQRPREDHGINVTGTLNVLESIRGASRPPGLLFASTNKVYGALPDSNVRQ